MSLRVALSGSCEVSSTFATSFDAIRPEDSELLWVAVVFPEPEKLSSFVPIAQALAELSKNGSACSVSIAALGYWYDVCAVSISVAVSGPV
jgi:hypothetical protein